MAKEFKSIANLKGNTDISNNSVAVNAFINNASGDFDNANKQNQQGKKPRGRPNKINKEEKVHFTLYLTKQQDEYIATKAEEFGVSKNYYIVHMLFKKDNAQTDIKLD